MYDEGGSTDFPGAPDPAPSFAPAEPPRPGLPWESETTGRSPGAGAATVRMVLFQPGEAFRAMRLDGGLADPLLFLLLFGTVGSAFGVLWQSFMRNWTAQLGGTDFADFAFANSYGLLTLIMAPLFVLLFGCIVAAVYHLALLIFGGAPRGFDVVHVGFALPADDPLLARLAGDALRIGGRLVAPLAQDAAQELVAVEKLPDGRLRKRVLLRNAHCQAMRRARFDAAVEGRSRAERLRAAQDGLQRWREAFTARCGRAPARADMMADGEAAALFVEFTNLRRGSWDAGQKT